MIRISVFRLAFPVAWAMFLAFLPPFDRQFHLRNPFVQVAHLVIAQDRAPPAIYCIIARSCEVDQLLDAVPQFLD
jgi:hypothetical protein